MARPTDPRPQFPRRTIVWTAFVPAFVFSTGLGAVLPLIASLAIDRGAPLAVAGSIAALLPLGQVVFDLPAGALTARIGDRAAMVGAGTAAALAFLAAALVPSVHLLGLAVFLTGCANAVFLLARHTYITAITPVVYRARVISTMGGIHRIGQFTGPFLGTAVLLFSEMGTVFLAAALTSLAAVAIVLLVKPEHGLHPSPGGPSGTTDVRGVGKLLVAYRRLLGTLGTAALLVGVVRGARQQVIPLWGEHIGLDPTMISLIFGIAGGADMLLFYPAGKIMDRFGRLWIGVPSMLLLSATMVFVPLTHTALQLTVVSVLLGLGNGLGSGVLMTIASDVAPSAERPQFFGIWRLLEDVGTGAGPLVLAGGAALGSLAAGVWGASAVGPIAAAGLQRWLPRYSVHANMDTRRRAERREE